MKTRTILSFWIPLAFSMLLMTAEGPWVQGVISRKPNAETQLAAFGLVMSLSITIEAPVIMMLATSNALCRDRLSYRVIWRYMMIVNVVLTVITALMAFTPLLDLWMGTILNVPQHIIDSARPALGIMLLWSAFIGHRRFHQGILISTARTGIVGKGTLVRIVMSASTAVTLGVLTGLSGAVIGGCALMVAVFSEMIYIYWNSRPSINEMLQVDQIVNRDPMTYATVARFHLPLALTSLMTLLVRPVIEKGLANTEDAELALAAWAVVFSVLLIMRAGGISWQEVVIALSKGEEQLSSLRRFTWVIGLATSGFLAIVAWTPLIDVYIGDVLGIPESVRPFVVTGARAGFLVPLLTTVQSYIRAVLMRSDNTNPIYQGMVVNIVITSATLWAGLSLDAPGIFMASLALTIGMLGETAFLALMYPASHQRLILAWQREAAFAVGD